MALEYSEVMAAGAMFSTATELKKASESTESTWRVDFLMLLRKLQIM